MTNIKNIVVAVKKLKLPTWIDLRSGLFRTVTDWVADVIVN